jgi:V/A-type H+-transporting ATPase subunit A
MSISTSASTTVGPSAVLPVDAENRPAEGGPRPGGRLVRVAGPVVTAAGLPGPRLFDVVRVGGERLAGEVIRLDGDLATIQVFEDTAGLRVGDPVEATGGPLVVELGPGLLGGIVDGTGRPLTVLAGAGVERPFIARGADPPQLDRERRWDLVPVVGVGEKVLPGDVLATVAETTALEHRVLVPPGHGGTVTAVRAGQYRVTDVVVEIDGRGVTMLQRWPVRRARPVAEHLPQRRPLITGTRVLDLLFPVALGGTAVIPGGFGTGKTMTEQSLAKHAAADVVVYVGCGERGNELTEVLQDFPELDDPRTGAPLMERTVLVANTSNMPVAAREASIYVGVTIAEYFRDQGYDVALMADSTSRWGEALREVSSRLEEIPAEDGYPAYLASRLAGFYERAGYVRCLGGGERTGSVTIVGAVSPAGGDFSEPITQNSLRIAGAFWALDTALARRRHYPAVNWTRSYSQYAVGAWFDREVAEDWTSLRQWALALLQSESALQDMVALLGVDALAPAQRLVLRTGQILREDVLQQSSFDPVDASCPPGKTVAMVRAARVAHEAMTAALGRGVPVDRVVNAVSLAGLTAMRSWPAAEAGERSADLAAALTSAMEEI